MDNYDFFKKDPLSEKDKIKKEDPNIDDSVLDYDEIDSSVPEQDIDELYDDRLLQDSGSEIISEDEDIAIGEPKMKEDLGPENGSEQGLDIEPEIETRPVPEIEETPVLKSAKKNVEDFDPENKGEILKRERLKKGLTLELVHEVTKVPMDVLKAIEEGYHVRNLSPFYLKGFLKIYAQFLEVDVSRVVGTSKREKMPAHVKYQDDQMDINKLVSKIFTRKRKQQIVIVLGILFLFFIVFKVSSFIANLKPNKKTVKVMETKKDNKENKAVSSSKKKITVRKPTAIDNTNKAAKKIDIKDVKVVESKKVAEPINKKVVETQVVKNTTEVKQVNQSPKAIPSVIPPQTQNVATNASSSPAIEIGAKKNVSLTVRAKKNSWLSVKVDGVVVFQSTLRLGSVETWMADESIEISGKNIDQLDFELNGKMIRSLGRKDSKAKRLIVTKEGLTVTN